MPKAYNNNKATNKNWVKQCNMIKKSTKKVIPLKPRILNIQPYENKTARLQTKGTDSLSSNYFATRSSIQSPTVSYFKVHDD